jgi:O-acetyl-ADP-ribose deacetylase (regulator of RNase III)
MTIGSCTIELVRGDITRIPVDAIVNAANASLAGGGGVDGAIHDAAGPSLMVELRQYNGCPTGSAVVTGAGNLPAKYVFHAVGPVYHGGHRDEATLLAGCYRKVVELALELGCESMSIPSISTGVYGYPIPEAAQVALSAIAEALPSEGTLRTIKLVQFNEASYNAYSKLMYKSACKQTSAQTS